MFARILIATVVVGATAIPAVGQQYYVPDQPANSNRNAPNYSLSDTQPAYRQVATPVPTRGVYTPPAEPTGTVGSSYLNQDAAGCAGSPNGNCGCAGSPHGGCAATPGNGWGDGASSDCGSSSCGDSCGMNMAGSRYRKVFGGWNEAYDINVPQTGTDFSFRSGYAMGAGIGRYLTCNLRHEMEVVYRNNSVNERSIGGAGNTPLSGNINAFSAGNVLLYDLNRLSVGGITPYVGGGIGGVYVDADFSDGVNTYAISDKAFAYQGILGAQKQMSSRMTGYAEYRFFGTTNLDFETPLATYDVTYQTHGVFVGIRIAR